MKTLERFWHWVDNEKPGPLTAAHHCHRADAKESRVQNISDMGLDALEAAALLITFRTRGRVVSQAWNRVYWCLDHHRRPLRDLSLGIAQHVALANERLPAPPPETAPEPTALEKAASPLLSSVVKPRVALATLSIRGQLMTCPRCLYTQPTGMMSCQNCAVSFLYVAVANQ